MFIFLISLDCNASELKPYTKAIDVDGLYTNAGDIVYDNKKDNKKRLLIKYTTGGNVETVERLLKEGADKNSTDDSGKTLLILAALGRKQKVVDMLLTFKPELDQQDNRGITALMYASPSEFNLNEEIHSLHLWDFNSSQALLMKEGLENLGIDDDVLKIEKAKKIVIHSKLIDSLIKAGADPEIKNKAGKSFQDCITSKYEDKDIEELRQFIKNRPIDIMELMQKLLSEK